MPMMFTEEKSIYFSARFKTLLSHWLHLQSRFFYFLFCCLFLLSFILFVLWAWKRLACIDTDLFWSVSRGRSILSGATTVCVCVFVSHHLVHLPAHWLFPCALITLRQTDYLFLCLLLAALYVSFFLSPNDIFKKNMRVICWVMWLFGHDCGLCVYMLSTSFKCFSGNLPSKQ